MKRLLALFLVLMILLPACSFAETDSLIYEDGEMNVYYVHIDEEVEARLDQYIAQFGLTEESKAVIINYLPDVNNFDRMEQEGFSAYSIFTKDGTEYFLTVMKDLSPMVLQSAEKDYKLRTRYYDKFAK